MRFLILATLCTIWVSIAPQVVPGKDLSLLVQPAVGYSEPIYGRGPSGRSENIYFAGEPIAFRLIVFNGSRQVLIAKTGGREPNETLVADVRVDDADAQRIEGTTSDVGSEWLLKTPTEVTQITWSTDVVLQPGWSMMATCDLHSRVPLPPGHYLVDFKRTSLGCGPDCQLYSGGARYFEVKAADSVPERVDLHLMRAMTAIDGRRMEEADREIGQALALYPNAYAAYQVIGMKADAQSHWREAAEAYEHAIALLELKKDTLRYSGEKALPALRSAAQRARSFAGRHP
jgi:hypothetical protein